MKKLDSSFIAPKSGKAKQLVIFLHGYGANGDDLLSIGEEWSDALPDAVFVAPNAPEPCEAYPVGYQWFSIRAIDRNVIEREKQTDKAAAILNAFIDEQLAKWGVDDAHLAVIGFSQGAMMAMYVLPRRQKPAAGIIGYSGMLVDAEGLKGQGIVKVPVLAIHGEADTVVPPDCLEHVQQGFTMAGFDVETVMRPNLGHGIDQFGLIRGLEFIKERFELADKTGQKPLQAKA